MAPRKNSEKQNVPTLAKINPICWPTVKPKLREIKPFLTTINPNEEKFTINPVWKHGPLICKATMLPAFETEKGRETFLSDGGEGVIICARFQCNFCNFFHADIVAPPPGWSSASGVNRQVTKSKAQQDKEKYRFKQFWKESSEKH